MPVVYALLCGMLVYLTILALFGRRLPPCNRWTLGLGSLALALSFAILALSTSGIIRHGTHAALTRLGFIGYWLSIAWMIGRYWRDALRARRR